MLDFPQYLKCSRVSTGSGRGKKSLVFSVVLLGFFPKHQGMEYQGSEDFYPLT